jgi:hypothetical protein
MAETDRASLLRVTGTGGENGTGVGNDSSPPWTEGSHKRDEGMQQRGQQQLPPREEASRGAKDMTETLKAAQPRTHRTSATNGQAIRREVFQVGVRGQQHMQAQTKCISCGLWGARLSVDTERSSFACNTRCMRRWQLDQIAACRRQEPTQKRGCGCGERGPEEEGDPPSTHCNSGLTTVGFQLQQACAGCKAEAQTNPCARCWEVWYCSDECARAHWPQHQTQCQRGAWCGGCGNDGQSVWCEECNKAAYCSEECRERDRRDHHKECDGRWTQKRTLTEVEERPHVASHFARDS